ncbi:MAG: portal protein [Planctomycetota bacterium]|jgi:hypothetical protein
MSVDIPQSTLAAVEGTSRFVNRASYELNLQEPGQAVEFVRRAVEASKEELGEWYAQASVNLAWTAGKQLVDWDKNAGKTVQDPRYAAELQTDRRRIPIWTNFMRRYVISSMARVTNARITWKTRPATNDQADVQSSNALSKLLPHWWDELEVDDQEGLLTAWWYLFATGLVYANPVWDEDIEHRRIIGADDIREMINEFVSRLDPADPDYPADPEAAQRRFFAEKIGAQMDDVIFDDDGSVIVDTGKAKLNWLSGFDVLEDLSARKWVDKRWAIIRYRLPVASVRDRYGRKADHVTGKRWGETEGLFVDRPAELDSDGHHGIFEQTDLYVVWHRESKRYRRGFFAEICEGKVLRDGKNPYEHFEIPLIPIYQMPDPWGHRPTGTMDDLLPLQRAYNRTDAQVISHINQTVDPDWQAEDGAADDDYMQEHPLVHFHRVGHPEPHPAPVERLAPHVMQEKLMLADQFKELAGITEPSQGIPSSEARSGRAIMALNEREDMMLNTTVQSVERGLEKIAQMRIALDAQFGIEERTAYILGSGGEREALTYRGESFIAKAQNQGVRGIRRFDVKVEIAIKPSTAELRNEIDWYLERGLADADAHREDLMRAIRDGDLRGFDPTNYDRANVERENEYIKMWNDALTAGEIAEEQIRILFPRVVRVRVADNPTTHIRGHEYLLKNIGDKLESVIEEFAQQHIMEHVQDLRARADAWGAQEQQQGLRSQRPGGNGVGSPGVPRSEKIRYGR